MRSDFSLTNAFLVATLFCGVPHAAQQQTTGTPPKTVTPPPKVVAPPKTAPPQAVPRTTPPARVQSPQPRQQPPRTANPPHVVVPPSRTNPARVFAPPPQRSVVAPRVVSPSSGNPVSQHAVFPRTLRPFSYRPVVVMRAITVAPPQAEPVWSQLQVLGRAPRPGMVFIPGYYLWSANTYTYTWIDPAWADPPMQGAVWHTPQWESDNGEWSLREGFWRAPDGASVDTSGADYQTDSYAGDSVTDAQMQARRAPFGVPALTDANGQPLTEYPITGNPEPVELPTATGSSIAPMDEFRVVAKVREYFPAAEINLQNGERRMVDIRLHLENVTELFASKITALFIQENRTGLETLPLAGYGLLWLQFQDEGAYPVGCGYKPDFPDRFYCRNGSRLRTHFVQDSSK